MNYFKGLMNQGEQLYMRPPVPAKDVGKRLPPTKKPSSNQLGSIRESRTEVHAEFDRANARRQ